MLLDSSHSLFRSVFDDTFISCLIGIHRGIAMFMDRITFFVLRVHPCPSVLCPCPYNSVEKVEFEKRNFISGRRTNNTMRFIRTKDSGFGLMNFLIFAYTAIRYIIVAISLAACQRFAAGIQQWLVHLNIIWFSIVQS